MSGIPLGPFHLQDPIGRGGMGAVWRGRHARQEVPVAVKLMLGDGARRPAYSRAFRKEVQAVAGLGHPGIVLVLEHGEAGSDTEAASGGRVRAGTPYLAMELAAGTLRDAGRGLDWRRLRELLLSLLDALAHAHARGVIHRDLKPSNVLCFAGHGAGPRFKLADFGLAEVARGAHEDRDAISGTPWYMAPEQILGRWRDGGPWTDLYALGCLAWELVCGGPPFTHPTTQAVADAHLNLAPPALRPRGPVPAGFEAWLRRLLEKDPGARFQWAADAACALAALPDPEGAGSYGPLEPAERATAPVLDEQHTDPRLALARTAGLPGSAASPPGPPPLPQSWRGAAMEKAPVLLGAGLGLWGMRPIPFVGRERERDRLWSALADVQRDGRPLAVVLHGPAGSGKSRLAEWIAERAHEVGAASTLEAVHSPMATPSEGLAAMAARALRCQGLHGAALADQVGHALRRLGAQDPAEWQGLAQVVASTTGAGPDRPALSAAERHGLLAALLGHVTRERPAIVRLDDVQWGRDALAFAARVLRGPAAARLPVLLLLTVRDEALAERPEESAALQALLRLPGASSLEVAPLAASDHHHLVAQLLGLESTLVHQVEERTSGNPLFAVQLVGDWVQRGVLEPGPEGFTLRSGEAAALPQDIHEVWAEHVAALVEGRSPEFVTALELAAALGLAVDREEWEAACRAAGVEPAVGLVDALARRRLARRSEEGFAFVHAMLRESLERIAREAGRWTGHHRACAQVLQPLYARGERGAAERLARHLLAAERPAEAVDPLLRAAAERRETSDYARAHVLLERREQALDAAAVPAADPRRGEGWVLRARVFLHEGRLDDVFAWAQRAGHEAERHGWARALSEALRLQGDAARRRGRLDAAAELYERCVVLLDRLDNPHGVAGSLWGLGDVHRQRGRQEEAAACFRRSRALYEAIGDAHGVADHAVGMADLAWQDGDLDGAALRYEEARALFEALGNRYGVARSLNGLGEVARAGGRPADARAAYERALQLLEMVQSADAAFPRVNLGLVALAEGRYREARAVLGPLVTDLARLGWGGLLGCVQAALLACDAAALDWGSWDARFPDAAEAAAALEPDLAWAAELAALTAAGAGQMPRARRAAALAIEQWAGLGRSARAERLRARLR